MAHCAHRYVKCRTRERQVSDNLHITYLYIRVYTAVQMKNRTICTFDSFEILKETRFNLIQKYIDG